MNKQNNRSEKEEKISNFIFDKLLTVWLNAEAIDEEALGVIADGMASAIGGM